MRLSASSFHELTDSQKKIWNILNLNPDYGFINISDAIELKSCLNKNTFKQALNLTVRECENLRTTFHFKGDDIFFKVDSNASCGLDIINMPNTCGDTEFQSFLLELSLKKIDLTASPLCYFAIIQRSDGREYFFQKYHHMIMDGASSSLITTRLFEVYDCLQSNMEIPQNTLGNYSDYAQAESEYKSSARYLKDKSYWENRKNVNAVQSIEWITRASTDDYYSESIFLKSSTCQLLTSHL